MTKVNLQKIINEADARFDQSLKQMGKKKTQAFLKSEYGRAMMMGRLSMADSLISIIKENANIQR